MAYMDRIDFEEEAGLAAGGNLVFPSADQVRRYRPCSKECGVVKVAIRLVEVVEPGTLGANT